MELHLKALALIVLLAPLFGGVLAGVFGKKIGKSGAHSVTIAGVLISFVTALWIANIVFFQGFSFDGSIYTWAISGAASDSFQFNVGFLVDHLSTLMMLTVTFVSLLVHIFSIGYMAEDKGYQRFFSYMSLFTFFMLSLVLANNFLLLFFGWEGVGLISYLLIGFWFDKESANQGSLKAFLVNRIGDAGFLLGMAAILVYFKTLNYEKVFADAASLQHTMMPVFGSSWSVMSVICILLFIGAMGKSAQMPLHVWLPESMEGPTPISALIHAATMVTAGVYMLARMSPLFQFSATAQSTVLIIGASTCFFMGILGVFQNDIKRVIAYSTLSQLGYMVAAAGVSDYAAGMFHLVTHAAFKALLFLAAGSVILAMHHEQDMRKMGGLRRYMPWTYVTFLIGSFALIAMPPFSGFYSKDSIIAAVDLSTIPGSAYASFCVTAAVFVTALYTFRAFFMTFHGPEKFDEHTRAHLKESPWVVRFPLIALSIPSAALGFWMMKPALLSTSLFGYSLIQSVPTIFESAGTMALDAVTTLTFWLMIAGMALAFFMTISFPKIGSQLRERFKWLAFIFENHYGFDAFNKQIFVRGAVGLGSFLFYIVDLKFIDHIFVNGTGLVIGLCSKAGQRLQSGYLYHYLLVMILALVAFVIWVTVGF